MIVAGQINNQNDSGGSVVDFLMEKWRTVSAQPQSQAAKVADLTLAVLRRL